jgi:RsiW-degrading membrane proteinase PrsW (M82 family)
MGLLLSLLFGFVPMFFFAVFIYWLDRYEKEPKLLLGAAFFWGAVIAVIGAFILNTSFEVGAYLLTQSDAISSFSTAVVSAPLFEETLKGLAVLCVFLFFRKEFDSVLDGIIYAAITALGFAASENALYIYTKGYAVNGWAGFWELVFIRVIVVGWQHPFYTSFTGIGLAYARLNKNWAVKILAPLAGWIVAMSAHGLHNTLASLGSGVLCLLGTFLDWSGWIFMFVFILYMIWREKKWIQQYLRNEIALGILTPQQYETACSATRQTLARLSALNSGRYLATNRFYTLCGELAHKNRQYATLGDEGGNAAIIQKLRQELQSLSPRAAA